MEKSYGVIPVYRSSDSSFRYLVVQAPDAIEWTFPKGIAENDETAIEAATRELKEETGIEHIEIIPNINFVHTYQYTQSGKRRNKQATFFIGIIPEMVLITKQSEEIGDYRWVDYKETEVLPMFLNQRHMLQEVQLLLTEKFG